MAMAMKFLKSSMKSTSNHNKLIQMAYSTRSKDHTQLFNKLVQDQSRNPRDFIRMEGPKPQDRKSCWASAAVELLQARLHQVSGIRLSLSVRNIIKTMPGPRDHANIMNHLMTAGITVKGHPNSRVYVTKYRELEGKEAILKALHKRPLGGFIFAHATLHDPQFANRVITLKDVRNYDLLPKRENLLSKRKNKICTICGGKIPNFCWYCGYYGEHEAGHHIVLTGFDMSSNTPYIRFKNSWGDNWGQKGFGRLEITDKCEIKGDQQCGVMDVFCSAIDVDVMIKN